MKRLLTALSLCLCGAVASAGTVDLSHPIEAGGPVRVDIRYGTLRIVGSQDGVVRVTGEIGETLRGVSAELEAGAVEVRVEYPFWTRLRSLWEGSPVHRAELTIEVPRDTPLFVVSRDAAIEIRDVAGPVGVGVVSSDVVIRGEPRYLNVETVSGRLDFEGRCADVRASSLSGDLRLAGVDGSLRLESATGALEVAGAGLQQATLTTVSGAIALRGTPAAGASLRIATQSGEVRLAGGAAGGALDLETRDGEILNEIDERAPIRDERGRRVLESGAGEAGARLTVRTRSGHIWLTE